MGFPILVRRRLYIESGPCFLLDIRDNVRLSHVRPHSLTNRLIPGWQTLHDSPLSFFMVEYTIYWSLWQDNCRSHNIGRQWYNGLLLRSIQKHVCHVLVLRMETKWWFAKEYKACKYIDSKLKPSHRDGYIEISIKYLQTALSVYRHFIAHKMLAYSKPYNEIGIKRWVQHQEVNHIYFLYHILCDIASNNFATICTCICSWLNCLGIYHCIFIYIYNFAKLN